MDGNPGGDDWLADDLSWFPTGRVAPARSGPEGSPSAPVEKRFRDSPAKGPRDAPSGIGRRVRAMDTVHRRRVVAVTAVGLLVGAAILVPLVFISSGGGTATSTTPPPAPTTETTTQAATQPAVAPQQPPATTTTPQATTATPKPLGVSLPAGGKLRRGDRGGAVTQLQKALVALGWEPGTPDGAFGAHTETALVAYQKANGLDPDGVVGSATARAINAELARKNAAR